MKNLRILSLFTHKKRKADEGTNKTGMWYDTFCQGKTENGVYHFILNSRSWFHREKGLHINFAMKLYLCT